MRIDRWGPKGATSRMRRISPAAIALASATQIACALGIGDLPPIGVTGTVTERGGESGSASSVRTGTGTRRPLQACAVTLQPVASDLRATGAWKREALTQADGRFRIGTTQRAGAGGLVLSVECAGFAPARHLFPSKRTMHHTVVEMSP